MPCAMHWNALRCDVIQCICAHVYTCTVLGIFFKDTIAKGQDNVCCDILKNLKEKIAHPPNFPHHCVGNPNSKISVSNCNSWSIFQKHPKTILGGSISSSLGCTWFWWDTDLLSCCLWAHYHWTYCHIPLSLVASLHPHFGCIMFPFSMYMIKKMVIRCGWTLKKNIWKIMFFLSIP